MQNNRLFAQLLLSSEIQLIPRFAGFWHGWHSVAAGFVGCDRGVREPRPPDFEESQVGRHAPDGLHIFNTRSTREDRNWVEYELKRSPGGLRTRKTIENMAPDCLEVALVSVGPHRGVGLSRPQTSPSSISNTKWPMAFIFGGLVAHMGTRSWLNMNRNGPVSRELRSENQNFTEIRKIRISLPFC